IAGPWDAVAEGAMQCCDLHALKGDQHVEIDWTGTRLSMQGASKLLDSALVPQPVVESIIGRKLTAPPEPGQAGGALGARSCTYTTTMPGGGILRQQF